MQNSEFAYFSSKSGKHMKQMLVHHFGGVLAWKSGLRFWIPALEVPFSVVGRPTQLIYISDIYLLINTEIQIWMTKIIWLGN